MFKKGELLIIGGIYPTIATFTSIKLSTNNIYKTYILTVECLLFGDTELFFYSTKSEIKNRVKRIKGDNQIIELLSNRLQFDLRMNAQDEYLEKIKDL